MNDYAAYLAAEANSDIAAMHQFMILYDGDGGAYHFFFEGEDDSLFFMPEARRYTRDKVVHVYDCGGKRNVVQVRDEIRKAGYCDDSCLFFVDRDYDDFLNTQVALDDRTYITDNYSIENDISSIEAARIFMVDILRMSKADPEFARIESEISESFEAFYLEVRALTGWILAAKEQQCRPNLRNTKGLKGIVEIVGVKPVLTREGFLEFKRKVVVNEKLPQFASVLKWTRRLAPESAQLWVRGKYCIWFFQGALIAAVEAANMRIKAQGGRPIQLPSSLREGRIFEVLGGRVPVPPSLQAFYEARLT